MEVIHIWDKFKSLAISGYFAPSVNNTQFTLPKTRLSSIFTFYRKKHAVVVAAIDRDSRLKNAALLAIKMDKGYQIKCAFHQLFFKGKEKISKSILRGYSPVKAPVPLDFICGRFT